MGNGRKTGTLSEKGKYEVNWARNLPTNKLATVIFGCKNHTVVECFDKEIFVDFCRSSCHINMV
ncbi:hypothetical protein ACS0TY_018521 [Phlomoides rotata]